MCALYIHGASSYPPTGVKYLPKNESSTPTPVSRSSRARLV